MKRLGIILAALCMAVSILPVSAQAAPAEVAAKSAILMDLATGTVLFEQNAHEKLPPASVTKVMTMLLIMEAIDQGRIGWDDSVTASDAAAAKGGSQIYLKSGETMSVTDMLKAIAVSSANDAACAMAEHIAGSEEAFVQQMNARAAELGMEDTHFVNCTGLDDQANAAEHLTSAHDIAVMSRQLLLHHPEIKKFTTVWMDTLRGGTFGLSNTNKMIRFYSGATGLKTGFTAKAGYCLSASALREGMELVAVVMGSATSKDRFAACKSLLDYGFANFALIRSQSQEGGVPVKLGEADRVTATPVREPCLLIDKAQKNTVTTQITLDKTVTAPVSKGQRLGTLTIRAGEQVLDQIPLVAAAPVRKLTWGQMFAKVLGQICMAKS